MEIVGHAPGRGSAQTTRRRPRDRQGRTRRLFPMVTTCARTPDFGATVSTDFGRRTGYSPERDRVSRKKPKLSNQCLRAFVGRDGVCDADRCSKRGEKPRIPRRSHPGQCAGAGASRPRGRRRNRRGSRHRLRRRCLRGRRGQDIVERRRGVRRRRTHRQGQGAAAAGGRPRCARARCCSPICTSPRTRCWPRR